MTLFLDDPINETVIQVGIKEMADRLQSSRELSSLNRFIEGDGNVGGPRGNYSSAKRLMTATLESIL